jgi:hypothetical protein
MLITSERLCLDTTFRPVSHQIAPALKHLPEACIIVSVLGKLEGVSNNCDIASSYHLVINIPFFRKSNFITMQLFYT